MGDIKALLGESFSEWSRHKGARLGASLAFYTLLSLVVVSVAGLVFGPENRSEFTKILANRYGS